jgi:hypothetical protein
MPPPGVGEEHNVQIAQNSAAAAGALVPVQYEAPIAQQQRPAGVVAQNQLTAAHASIGGPSGPRRIAPTENPVDKAPAAIDAAAAPVDQPSVIEQLELFLAFVGGAALLMHGLKLLLPAK